MFYFLSSSDLCDKGLFPKAIYFGSSEFGLIAGSADLNEFDLKRDIKFKQ